MGLETAVIIGLAAAQVGTSAYSAASTKSASDKAIAQQKRQERKQDALIQEEELTRKYRERESQRLTSTLARSATKAMQGGGQAASPAKTGDIGAAPAAKVPTVFNRKLLATPLGA